MNGLMNVDNPGQSASQQPIAPEPTPSPAPAAMPEPVVPVMGATPPAQVPQSGPPARNMDMLNALLDGADPTTLLGTQPPAAATPPQPDVPAAPPAQPGQGQQPVQPTQGDPGTAVPDKFRNPDGSVNTDALMKSYLGMEKVLGEQGNKLGQMGQMQSELLNLRNIVHQINAANTVQPGGQSQAQAPPAEEAPKFPWEIEMTPEEAERAREEYFEDPIKAIAKRDQQTMKAMEHRLGQMLEGALKPLAPVVESHQQIQQVQTFTEQIEQFKSTGTAPDFEALKPQMTQIVQQYGEWLEGLPNPIEVVYRMAKGMTPAPAQAASPPPTFEQMIADPNNRAKILADQSIVNQIRQGYIQEVAQGAPPVVIGAQPGGVAAATPGEKPRSARDAGKMFTRFMSQ